MIESKDIVALLKQSGNGKTIEVQLKGASYEVTIDNGYDEAVSCPHGSGAPPPSPPIPSFSPRRISHGRPVRRVHTTARATSQAPPPAPLFSIATLTPDLGAGNADRGDALASQVGRDCQR